MQQCSVNSSVGSVPATQQDQLSDRHQEWHKRAGHAHTCRASNQSRAAARRHTWQGVGVTQGMFGHRCGSITVQISEHEFPSSMMEHYVYLTTVWKLRHDKTGLLMSERP